ncbi:bifunctional oligoribonuclease/PAP phosphatase NrnA [Metallumcola ferriviriculae]|uniref:Bifunctional oligoribonuclease/PAP phosphatase NrnA n=1 Tax=Metallumcola ferriviriculae TaxID=3039180 RepID=A0AAU0UPZ3_9FIRM|nr:bifunctional oligoribonuclease/PAP phosphatase NrnA [Desulfitibacteraceae bacterium MK1]
MLNKIVAVLKKHQNILITSHVIPDGDSIGSTLALGLALKSMGKNVIMVNNDPVPEMYGFLFGSDEIKQSSEIVDVPALCVAVDCTGLERIGDELQQIIIRRQPQVINIDHHISNTNFGSYNVIDPEAAAAGEMIYDLIAAMGVELNIHMANALYVALATDTGSFQYGNTKQKTLEIASLLLGKGVKSGIINQTLHENRSLTSIRLLAAVLPSLNVSEDGQLAYMWVDIETMQRLGADSEHCEGFVNYPKSIKGVKIALFFRQMDKHTVKVALRSKDDYDVNRIARVFGGGGHAKAAGCSVNASLDEAIRQVVGFVNKKIN